MKSIIITDRSQVANYIDTKVRGSWEAELRQFGYEPKLGNLEIISEQVVRGHKVWNYHIDGLPMSRDGRQRWLIDTGETLETTLTEDERTLEGAYLKQYGIPLETSPEQS